MLCTPPPGSPSIPSYVDDSLLPGAARQRVSPLTYITVIQSGLRCAYLVPFIPSCPIAAVTTPQPRQITTPSHLTTVSHHILRK
ncbi:hypothetical protein FJTKL_04749 [Diaporthe vaccinii]|uniref:Uncharacterized protein n=1 Tax=Diaporthe vaccinii TaxID=105482 RepID=A0ABR4EZZ7_9PEZI